MATIKEIETSFRGTAGLESRRYITRYLVTGLNPATDTRPQILPTSVSTGIFPTPGTFPSTMPDGRAIFDSPVRVVSVTVEASYVDRAIVAVEMESRIGTFDQEGSFLLDMRITSAVEYIPSNFDIKTDGTRNTIAFVRYLSAIMGNTTAAQRVAQLNIPRNRKTITIVQAEPTSYAGTTHYAKSGYCAFTNSSTFWGGASRTWLCTALESQWTGFYDKPWRTTYQFVYNPDQWTGIAYFNDQSLGLPMQDILAPANFDPGTESASPYGCKVFRIAGEADFAALNLPNPTTAG